MQTKKAAQHSRRLQTIAKLYTPEQKPVFKVPAAGHPMPGSRDSVTLDYAGVVRKELVKSLGLTFVFIVLQCILYFAYFNRL